MDKNTLTGLVLMGLLIFGFMWMNNGKQRQLEQQKMEQAEAQNAADNAAAKKLTVDSITAAEAAAFPAVIREIGTTRGDSASAVSVYRTANVNLSYNGTAVSGTVKAADTVLSYDAVVSNRFGADVPLAVRNEAIANLRGALDEAQKYGAFARYRNGQELEALP